MSEQAHLSDRVIVYQVGGDDAIHLKICGVKIGAFGVSTKKAQALLKYDASQRDSDSAIHDLLEALKMARECIAYCRRAHKDAQSGEGIPVELLIDAAIAKATGGDT